MTTPVVTHMIVPTHIGYGQVRVVNTVVMPPAITGRLEWQLAGVVIHRADQPDVFVPYTNIAIVVAKTEDEDDD